MMNRVAKKILNHYTKNSLTNDFAEILNSTGYKSENYFIELKVLFQSPTKFFRSVSKI